jgi:hypothetical protein
VNESPADQPTADAFPSGRLFCAAFAVFVLCAGLLLAYQHGFRVFDGTMWNAQSKESVILSIPELLVFFGCIALGIISCAASLVAAIIWLVQHLRHAPNTNACNA